MELVSVIVELVSVLVECTTRSNPKLIHFREARELILAFISRGVESQAADLF